MSGGLDLRPPANTSCLNHTWHRLHSNPHPSTPPTPHSTDSPEPPPYPPPTHTHPAGGVGQTRCGVNNTERELLNSPGAPLPSPPHTRPKDGVGQTRYGASNTKRGVTKLTPVATPSTNTRDAECWANTLPRKQHHPGLLNSIRRPHDTHKLPKRSIGQTRVMVLATKFRCEQHHSEFLN